MIDASISRARLRDLAVLGRVHARPRTPSSRPGADDLEASII